MCGLWRTLSVVAIALLSGCPETAPSEVSIERVDVAGDATELQFGLRIAGRGFATRTVVYDVSRREGRIAPGGLTLEIFAADQKLTIVPEDRIAIDSPAQLTAQVVLTSPLDPGRYGVRLRGRDGVLAELARAFEIAGVPVKDSGIGDAGAGDDAGDLDAEPRDGEPREVGPVDEDAGLDANDGGPDAEMDAAVLDADAPDADEPDLGQPDGGTFADFVPSNIEPTLLTAGTDAIVLRTSDGIVTIDTDTGAIFRASDNFNLRAPGVVFTGVAQNGGPALGVFSASSVTIEPGVVVDLRGAAALVIAAAFDVTIDGQIIARGGRGAFFTGGPGGYPGADGTIDDGIGPGAGFGAFGANDTGGGGAGHFGAGGSGGNRAAELGGAGGVAYGNASLVPLVGGSGGGLGGGDPVASGRGGGGGGAVQISARGILTIGATGGINCGGGGGEGGALDDGGGGGGSGGAILLESPAIQLLGYLTANGGGGGAGANVDQLGASGQSGRPDTTRAQGGSGNADGSAGGAGGAGLTADGLPGIATTGVGADDNAGGGGGGGGRVRLRGEVIDNGIVSPASGLTTAPL